MIKNILFGLLVASLGVIVYIDLNKKDDFTIAFPEKPYIEENKTDAGPAVFYTAENGTKSFIVFKSEFEGGFKEGEIEYALSNTQVFYNYLNTGAWGEGAVVPEDAKITRISSYDLEFKGHKAQSAFAQNKNRYIRSLTFTDEKRFLYTLLYVDDKETFDESKAQAFFGSFREL